jgi:ribosome-associated protein
MKFELEEEYIELFKLLKTTGVAESGGQAKMLIEEGQVKRNGEVETRKRAKIVAGERIEMGGEVIEVESTFKRELKI